MVGMMAVMAKRPTKPQSDDTDTNDEEWVTRSIRFPPDLYARIERDAKTARRSTQLQIIWLIEEFYRTHTDGAARVK